MKITNESLYTQVLDRMSVMTAEMKELKKELVKMERDAFEYQGTEKYRVNRNCGNTIDAMVIAGQEYEELKSTYGGKE